MSQHSNALAGTPLSDFLPGQGATTAQRASTPHVLVAPTRPTRGSKKSPALIAGWPRNERVALHTAVAGAKLRPCACSPDAVVSAQSVEPSGRLRWWCRSCGTSFGENAIMERIVRNWTNLCMTAPGLLAMPQPRMDSPPQTVALGQSLPLAPQLVAEVSALVDQRVEAAIRRAANQNRPRATAPQVGGIPSRGQPIETYNGFNALDGVVSLEAVRDVAAMVAPARRTQLVNQPTLPTFGQFAPAPVPTPDVSALAAELASVLRENDALRQQLAALTQPVVTTSNAWEDGIAAEVDHDKYVASQRSVAGGYMPPHPTSFAAVAARTVLKTPSPAARQVLGSITRSEPRPHAEWRVADGSGRSRPANATSQSQRGPTPQALKSQAQPPAPRKRGGFDLARVASQVAAGTYSRELVPLAVTGMPRLRPTDATKVLESLGAPAGSIRNVAPGRDGLELLIFAEAAQPTMAALNNTIAVRAAEPLWELSDAQLRTQPYTAKFDC